MNLDAAHRIRASLFVPFVLAFSACGGGGGGAGQPQGPKVVSVALSAPASNALVGVNTTQNITASIANISASRLTWTVLPAGQAANVTITSVSSSSTSAVVGFRATVTGNYTVKVTSQDDATKTAQIDLRVHNVYTAIDGYGQRRAFLRADGRVVGTGLGDAADAAGAPTDVLEDIAQGERFRVGIKSDGTVVSWGPALSEGLDGPVAPPSGLTQVAKVDAGAYHAIAIRENGTLSTWGEFNGSDVRLPDGYSTRKFTAVGVLLGSSVALEDSGVISVWDANSGNLQTLPAQWQGRTFEAMCVTNWHVLAIDSTGALLVWNPINDEDEATGTPPATSGPVAAVYCGSDNAVLAQENGRVRAWGVNLGGGDFDSNSVAGFPRIKGASLFAYGEPYFLSESGAIVDRTGNILTAIDDL